MQIFCECFIRSCKKGNFVLVKKLTWIASIFVSAHYWRYYCSQISRQLSWISSGTYHLRSWVMKVDILILTGIASSGTYHLHKQKKRIEFFRSYWKKVPAALFLEFKINIHYSGLVNWIDYWIMSQIKICFVIFEFRIVI